MAPLNKVLFLYPIFLLFLFITSSFISATPQRSNLVQRRTRALLELEDEDDGEQPPQIIKKKSKTIFNDGDEPIIKKKSKTILNDGDEDEHPQPIIKKKSKTSLDNGEDEHPQPIIKKKSKTILNDGDEDEHPQPIIKKKSKTSLDNGDEDEHPQPIIKEKSKTILNDGDEPIIKKKSKTSIENGDEQKENQTKIIKPSSKALKVKSKINSTYSDTYSTPSKLMKLNSTSNSTTKTKTTANSTTSNSTNQNQQQQKKKKVEEEDEDEDGLVSEFKDLTFKFQESFVPDLNRISKTSKIYLNKYNKEFENGFKPYVGNKHAPTIASFVSFVFIVVPLILISLVFNRIKAYFSLQRLLIFIQVYLSIYFMILCLSAIATGLEPLRFLYSTSKSTYICVHVLQTLAYMLYLLLLLMYLVLVFSTETGPGTKLLGLAQTIVGFVVGLHYYMTVFHTAVRRQPPKTSWKVHAVYATCFFVICLLARMDSRKKAYLEEGGEEGKKN